MSIDFQHTSVDKNRPGRFWEIDLLRGIAVIMMIVFHTLYDLDFFHIYTIELYKGFFLIYAYVNATIFILLVGLSLTLSYARVKKTLTSRQLHMKYLIRGLKILALGFGITLVTWFYLSEGFVVFGALHCIGVSIILAYPFLRGCYHNLVIGVSLILIGILLRMITVAFPWLLWLGVRPVQFYTIDYYPLLPWFGIVLLGIFLGKVLYPNHTRRFKLRDYSDWKLVQFIGFLGRHSLVIYLIHQPVLIGLIYVFLL